MKLETHLDDWMYAVTCDACAPHMRYTSETPQLTRNSSVYSINGMFANGSKHRGRSSVRGENRGRYESHSTTA